MAVTQPLPGEVGREQYAVRFVERETPPIPSHGADGHPRGVVRGARLVEHVAESDASPVSLGVPAARAVEERPLCGGRIEVVDSQFERSVDQSPDRERPRRRVDRIGVVGDPTGDGQVGVAVESPRPGEPAGRRRRSEQGREPPQARGGDARGGDEARVLEGDPSLPEVGPAERAIAGAQVDEEERDEEQAKEDVEVEERPEAEGDGDADGPRDARRRRGHGDGGERDGERGRAVPRPPVADSARDPTELEHEKRRDREAGDGVHPEDGGVGGVADPEAGDPGGRGEGDEREQRPVHQPRRRAEAGEAIHVNQYRPAAKEAVALTGRLRWRARCGRSPLRGGRGCWRSSAESSPIRPRRSRRPARGRRRTPGGGVRPSRGSSPAGRA